MKTPILYIGEKSYLLHWPMPILCVFLLAALGLLGCQNAEAAAYKRINEAETRAEAIVEITSELIVYLNDRQLEAWIKACDGWLSKPENAHFYQDLSRLRGRAQSMLERTRQIQSGK